MTKDEIVTIDVVRNGKYWNSMKAHAREYLCKELKPRELEVLIGLLFRRMGFIDVNVSGGTGDGGIDVVCTYVPEFGLTTTKFSVQVKQMASGKISPNLINQIRGAGTASNSIGMLVTTAYFTKNSIKIAEESKPKVILMNGEELVERLIDYKLWPDLFERKSEFFENAEYELNGSSETERNMHKGAIESIEDSRKNENNPDLIERHRTLMQNTTVLEFQINGIPVILNSNSYKRIGWNPIRRHCLSIALERGENIENLGNFISVKSNPTKKNGYAEISGSDYMVLGCDADNCCGHLRKLSKILNINISVKFKWNSKAPKHLRNVVAVISFNNGEVSLTSEDLPNIMNLLDRR